MRLKELRHKYGYTQKSLARRLNTTGQTILNWENEIYNPSVKQLINLANIFNCSIDYLVNRDKEISFVDDLCHEIEKIPSKEFVAFIRASLKERN